MSKDKKSKSKTKGSAAKAKKADKSKRKKKVAPIPTSYSNVIPSFRVAGCAGALEFLREVFGAKIKDRYDDPSGAVMHAELRIGDTTLMCGEAPAGDVQTLCASIYVKNCDKVFDEAVRLGAKVKQAPEDQFYGDRSARVIDPWGNEWIMATHIEDVSPKEMKRRMAAMMSGGEG